MLFDEARFQSGVHLLPNQTIVQRQYSEQAIVNVLLHLDNRVVVRVMQITAVNRVIAAT